MIKIPARVCYNITYCNCYLPGSWSIPIDRCRSEFAAPTETFEGFNSFQNVSIQYVGRAVRALFLKARMARPTENNVDSLPHLSSIRRDYYKNINPRYYLR